MSKTSFFTPNESFFVRIEGIISPIGSMCKGRSISMRILSAGAVLSAPPQIIHPFSLEMISFSLSYSNATGANTSIESAVPEGDVIALVDDLGIIKPAAATIGTIINETLFPGTPPVLCLSKTSVPKLNIFPLRASARVKAVISS